MVRIMVRVMMWVINILGFIFFVRIACLAIISRGRIHKVRVTSGELRGSIAKALDE